MMVFFKCVKQYNAHNKYLEFPGHGTFWRKGNILLLQQSRYVLKLFFCDNVPFDVMSWELQTKGTQYNSNSHTASPHQHIPPPAAAQCTGHAPGSWAHTESVSVTSPHKRRSQAQAQVS